MKSLQTLVLAGLLALWMATPAPAETSLPVSQALTRIAFGSCADEQRPQPFWASILAQSPELFLFLGDNVYATVRDGVPLEDPDVAALRAAYADLAAQPGWQMLRARVPVLATWDDHDYGLGDGGEENPIKDEAKAVFMEFFDVAANHPMRQRGGIYQSAILGSEGRRIQVILLDTRWFRSPLTPSDTPMAPGRERYMPDSDPGKTLLGEEQWRWLEAELRKPAELRLIASSIQILARNHGWERWRNFPHEEARLVELVRETGASGVVLLSGDRHRGAVYRRIDGVPYPLHELTSSSLNASFRARRTESDAQRLGPMFEEDNFGLVSVDWNNGVVHLDLHAVSDGRRVRGLSVDLAELTAR
jgi:alkaline phosphatase D